MNSYDLIIRGGHIVDGSGEPGFDGDLAIKGGEIAAVGIVGGSAPDILDAQGCIVAPGFIDAHTHLDAQVGWDPDLTPVSWHGVTTALIGNCGMTFAPCKPADRPLLASMMESVEDIPKEAILNGLSWDWEQYGDYLDAINGLQTAVNLVGLVGHAAVRYYVMGDRSFAEPATNEEVANIVALVEQALDSGACGFSTNRLELHQAPDGRPIPGTYAPVEELEAIAESVFKRGRLMQMVADNLLVGDDLKVLERIASMEGSRVLFNHSIFEPRTVQQEVRDLEAWRERADVSVTTHVRGSGFLFSLETGGLPFRGSIWKELNHMTYEQRLRAIQDPHVQAMVVTKSKRPHTSSIPLERVFYLGSGKFPDYANPNNLLQQAKASGEHWAETFIRLCLETRGRGLFNWCRFSPSLEDQAELFRCANVVPGLGDAGAHVSQIMDAGWPTFMLSHYVRERGDLSIELAVRKMTSDPARILGIEDRGLLKAGLRADVTVFYPEEVAALQPRLVSDFPGGARRFIQTASGYRAIIVNGVVSLLDGELTGARPGNVLRFVS